MDRTRVLATLLLVAGLGLAGCHDRPAAPSGTAVLGGYGNAPAASESALTDARGEVIPPPPVPAGTQAQVARSGDETALAVWVQDGHTVVSTFARPGGWTAAKPLETIYGVASDPQLASNGHGAALVVWRHTVGAIQSLRFSRFDAATGWSAPDVVPGALPRPRAKDAANHADAPRLAMNADGTVTARWPSGFAANEEQVARYTPAQGWSAAVSEPLPAAPSGSPARPAPSSAR